MKELTGVEYSIEEIKSFYDLFLEPYVFVASVKNNKGNVYVGFVEGKPLDDYAFYSSGIYVLPEYRGLGIAKKLNERQIKYAKSLGCVSITTSVYKRNIASLSLQKSFGAKIRFRGGLSYFVEIPL